MKQNLITTIITGLFVLLFAYTGASKLVGIGAFHATLSRSPLLSDFAVPIVILIPIVEIIIVILLCLSKTHTLGLYLSLILMLLFTCYVVYILNYSEKLPCSCGGIISQLNWKNHLILNVVLTLLAFVAICTKRLAPQMKTRIVGSLRE